MKQITKSNATGKDAELLETGKIRMIIQEANDETLRAVIPNGFYYVTGAPSTGLVVSDKFGDDDDNSKGGNQFVWVPCEGTNTVSYEKTNDGSVENKFGLASYWDKNNTKQYEYTKYKDWIDYGGDYDSVKKYGGFYVARYEAGVPSDAPFYANSDGVDYATTDKNTTEYTPVSKKNNQVWNYTHQITAKILSEKMYNGNEFITSQLIDSYAWDTIINWLEKEVLDIGNNSIGYGNYHNSGLEVNNALYAKYQYDSNGWSLAKKYKKGDIIVEGYTELATGATTSKNSSVKNKIKNIYDIAGNMWEWTTEVGNHSEEEAILSEEEAGNANYAVIRGGRFWR